MLLCLSVGFCAHVWWSGAVPSTQRASVAKATTEIKNRHLKPNRVSTTWRLPLLSRSSRFSGGDASKIRHGLWLGGAGESLGRDRGLKNGCGVSCWEAMTSPGKVRAKAKRRECISHEVVEKGLAGTRFRQNLIQLWFVRGFRRLCLSFSRNLPSLFCYSEALLDALFKPGCGR